MKTISEYRDENSRLRQRVSILRDAEGKARAELARVRWVLANVGMLSAGMRLAGSAHIADAIDEVLGIKEPRKEPTK